MILLPRVNAKMWKVLRNNTLKYAYLKQFRRKLKYKKDKKTTPVTPVQTDQDRKT